MKRFTLTPKEVEALEVALDRSLPDDCKYFLEMWLDEYQNRRTITPKDRARWAREDRELIEAGERLLDLIRRTSPEDYVEGHDQLSKRSPLHDAIEARVEQWKDRAARRVTVSRPWNEDSEEVPWDTPPYRPPDTPRLELIDRVCCVLDDSGLEIWRTWYTDGPRVQALLVIQQIANQIDGKKPGKGSMALIKKLKERRKAQGRFFSDRSRK